MSPNGALDYLNLITSILVAPEISVNRSITLVSNSELRCDCIDLTMRIQSQSLLLSSSTVECEYCRPLVLYFLCLHYFWCLVLTLRAMFLSNMQRHRVVCPFMHRRPLWWTFGLTSTLGARPSLAHQSLQ